jgi:hypothetical protein
MHPIVHKTGLFLILALIGLVALSVNVPLGYLRKGARKYSAAWFAYIHLSIPLIVFLRISRHVSPWFIPLFILCAVAGQLIGGRIRRRREQES